MSKLNSILLCEKVFDVIGSGDLKLRAISYQPDIPYHYCSCCNSIFIFLPPLYNPYRYIATLATEGENSNMGGQGGQEIDVSSLTIQKALDIVRNSEGSVDEAVSDYLESQLREIWDRIEAEPESYILSKDEFALFNYYRDRAPSSSLAQSAVQRFWNNYSTQQSSGN
jgi:hypothetical protein